VADPRLNRSGVGPFLAFLCALCVLCGEYLRLANVSQLSTSGFLISNFHFLFSNSHARCHNSSMPNPQWLECARRLQSMAQIGLTYCKDPYDRQRYEEIQRLAADIMANGAGLPDSAPLLDVFKKDLGYATPKIDIRTAVFDRDRILLVQEREDGLWTLPGGWADIGDSPSSAAIREVKEESGYDITISKLAAVYDRDKHDHPPMAFHVYKFFFLGDLRGGTATPSIETTAADFFPEDQFPPLSISRVTPAQLKHMFAHSRNPTWPTSFD
jgi:ADP-ribose pyrophosphatase YjhB (NUDIX family)